MRHGQLSEIRYFDVTEGYVEKLYLYGSVLYHISNMVTSTVTRAWGSPQFRSSDSFATLLNGAGIECPKHPGL
jgi:hypothetical protein